MTYTTNEAALIKILRAKNGKPLTTTDIVRLHYARREQPTFARQSVVCVLNHLVEKVRKNKEPFRIKKSVRLGPHPSTYWIEDL